jgi:hypothetical protein
VFKDRNNPLTSYFFLFHFIKYKNYKHFSAKNFQFLIVHNAIHRVGLYLWGNIMTTTFSSVCKVIFQWVTFLSEHTVVIINVSLRTCTTIFRKMTDIGTLRRVAYPRRSRPTFQRCFLLPSSGRSTHRCCDGGSKLLWNVGQLVHAYTTQYPRQLSSLHSPRWEPEMSLNV